MGAPGATSASFLLHSISTVDGMATHKRIWTIQALMMIFISLVEMTMPSRAANTLYLSIQRACLPWVTLCVAYDT